AASPAARLVLDPGPWIFRPFHQIPLRTNATVASSGHLRACSDNRKSIALWVSTKRSFPERSGRVSPVPLHALGAERYETVMPERSETVMPERSETGLPVRSDALDPGFHRVPAGVRRQGGEVRRDF